MAKISFALVKELVGTIENECLHVARCHVWEEIGKIENSRYEKIKEICKREKNIKTQQDVLREVQLILWEIGLDKTARSVGWLFDEVKNTPGSGADN